MPYFLQDIQRRISKKRSWNSEICVNQVLSCAFNFVPTHVCQETRSPLSHVSLSVVAFQCYSGLALAQGITEVGKKTLFLLFVLYSVTPNRCTQEDPGVFLIK